MHISLTPELETQVRGKVKSGLYNNASEVIREALRFMVKHEELIHQMKLNALREELSVGAAQADAGQFVSEDMEEILHEAKSQRG